MNLSQVQIAHIAILNGVKWTKQVLNIDKSAILKNVSSVELGTGIYQAFCRLLLKLTDESKIGLQLQADFFNVDVKVLLMTLKIQKFKEQTESILNEFTNESNLFGTNSWNEEDSPSINSYIVSASKQSHVQQSHYTRQAQMQYPERQTQYEAQLTKDQSSSSSATIEQQPYSHSNLKAKPKLILQAHESVENTQKQYLNQLLQVNANQLMQSQTFSDLQIIGLCSYVFVA